ncbi:MAG TPA: hypothetical protein VL086_21665 [Candidatus Nitrosotalea sp.]|nr:hypothetical protein [Candidatus Nitrosotalea sp.]
MRRLAWFVTLAALVLTPVSVRAQLFVAARPDPPFTVGPLQIRATVREGPGPVPVVVAFSLQLAPDRKPGDAAQDLYLLWPGEVVNDSPERKPDAALLRYVTDQGFDVIGEGWVGLAARNLSDDGRLEPLAPGASFVTFVQTGALGLSPPATFIRIPWTPRLVDRSWLIEISMRTAGLIKPLRIGWVERLVRGIHYRVAVGFHEVRDRPLFPMYFAHRDRVVRLADAPAELVVQFPQSDRLKIDEVYPPSSIRRLSETLESTEVVSLFLDRSEGLTPQQLAVQFGYFSRTQTLMLVAAPILFFALGQAMGPLLGRGLARAVEAAAARVQLGSWRAGGRDRHQGVIVPREVFERIAPGKATREDVLRLCGTEVERQERFQGSGRTTLIYRGRRLVPEAHRVFGWLSTVRHWDVERHEVRIELEGDLVRDVQAEVRRYRLGPEEPR